MDEGRGLPPDGGIPISLVKRPVGARMKINEAEAKPPAVRLKNRY